MIYLPLTETGVLAYAFLLGLFWLGTIPLTSGLIVTFFGPRWLSMLYGIVFLSHQLGSFMGAWIGGWLYDTYKSYDMLWWAVGGGRGCGRGAASADQGAARAKARCGARRIREGRGCLSA